MDKSVINTTILIFALALVCCQNEQPKETFTFIIDNASVEKTMHIKLQKKLHFQEMKILENSLTDTCMIGLMKIPPGKTGRLYRIEFLGDSLTYRYQPYKAKNGNLVIEHSFSD